MKFIRFIGSTLFTLGATVPVMAQGASPHPMQGWSCMMLNLTEQQSMAPNVHIAVRAEPSTDSKPIGYASETVAIQTPAKPVNGFLRAMFPTGREVWIAAGDVKPWHAAANPSARCVPVVKADGRIGFEYPQ
jgi:hypothetical protein